MSVSEIFNASEPHQWANLRINNLTVDGTFTGGPGTEGFFQVVFGAGEYQVPASITVRYVKIGNFICLHFPQIIGNLLAPGDISCPANTGIPPQFVSALGVQDFCVPVVAGGDDMSAPGNLRINTDGSMVLYQSGKDDAFAAGNSGTQLNFTISYIIV